VIENGGIKEEEFRARIRLCTERMEKANIDLLIAYGDAAHPENLIYLANYTPICMDMPGYGGYNGLFVLTRKGEATLIIDRDWQVPFAREWSWVEEILYGAQGDILGVLSGLLQKRGWKGGKVDLESTFIPARFYKALMEVLKDNPVDEKSRIVGRLREIKSPKEVELMTRGLEILAKAHQGALAVAKEGISEIDVAMEIRRIIMAESADFATALFVDAGRRSTIPLANPMASPYRIQKGDMVLVSIFCVYKNYNAGMDRAWVLGEPSPLQRKLAEIELKTHEKAVSLVRPSAKTTDFMGPVYHQYAEPMLREAGITEYNINGYVGHGAGVKVYEPPVLWKLEDNILRPGMVIDVEPGIYARDPKIGGLRTSSFVLVTEDGCRTLETYPKRIGSLA
jgi:Xaa-Pro aminopeptidase